MAAVPEINDISMESYSEEEFYVDYSCEMNGIITKGDNNHLGWEVCNSDRTACRSDPIQEIRRPRRSQHGFRNAVMIVFIVEKLKGAKRFERKEGRMLNDLDLLDDILVEEEISINDVKGTCAVRPKFSFSYSEVYMISDSRGKCLTLREYEGNAHLLALYLQNGNLESKVKINMGLHRSAPFDGEKAPVTLAIKGKELYLKCITEENNTVLSITNVTDIQKKKGNDLLPFLFYKRRHGTSHTFESVAYPGWYISTSQSTNQFVQMKAETDQQHIREFTLMKTA